MFNLVDKNSRSKRIAFTLLLVVGCLSIIGHTTAAGSGDDDLHLTLTIKDGMKNTAIGVGLAILICVYILIIFETVHQYSCSSTWWVNCCNCIELFHQRTRVKFEGSYNNDRLGNHWTSTRYDGYGRGHISYRCV